MINIIKTAHEILFDLVKIILGGYKYSIKRDDNNVYTPYFTTDEKKKIGGYKELKNVPRVVFPEND